MLHSLLRIKQITMLIKRGFQIRSILHVNTTVSECKNKRMIVTSYLKYALSVKKPKTNKQEKPSSEPLCPLCVLQMAAWSMEKRNLFYYGITSPYKCQIIFLTTKSLSSPVSDLVVMCTHLKTLIISDSICSHR